MAVELQVLSVVDAEVHALPADEKVTLVGAPAAPVAPVAPDVEAGEKVFVIKVVPALHCNSVIVVVLRLQLMVH